MSDYTSEDWGGMTIQEKELRKEVEHLTAEVERLERALNGAVKKLTRLEAARAARISKSSSITGGWG